MTSTATELTSNDESDRVRLVFDDPGTGRRVTIVGAADDAVDARYRQLYAVDAHGDVGDDDYDASTVDAHGQLVTTYGPTDEVAAARLRLRLAGDAMEFTA